MHRTEFMPRPRGWKLFLVLAALLCCVAALAWLTGPDAVEGSRRAIRATARTSFLLFLAAFTASAFAALLPGPFTRAVLRERRVIGLAFAFSHLLHGLAIYALGQLNPAFWPARSALGNVPGSVGFLFILLLAATSYRPLAIRLGRTAWRRLHTAGMWIIAAVFAYSYLKRVPIDCWYAAPSALLFTAIVIRVIGKRHQAGKRAGHAAAPRRAPLAQV